MNLEVANKKIKIEEKFDPRLISALYKNFKDANTAIFELIDNAIDGRTEEKQLIITITIKPDWITIVNKGGKGMGLEELEAFFIWGFSDKRGKLGRYGQGGKAAMGYLGKSWKIRSTKIKKEEQYVVEEQDWDDRTSGMKRYIPAVEKSPFVDDGVVQIDIWNLKKKVNKKELEKELGSIYRPLIKKEKIKITINNKAILPLYIPLEIPEEEYSFSIEEKKKISGWLSFLESGSSMRGGVRCFEYGRLISDREFFGQKDPSYKESIDRLVGELYIDFEIPLLMNKTDFDRDSRDWEKIEVEMRKRMEPYIRLLLEEKEKDLPTEKERKAVDYAGGVWKDFLKYLQFEQKEGSLPGLPIDYGQKPRDILNDQGSEGVRSDNTLSTREPYEPVTPPPIDKVGKRKRTGAYLKPIPKPLPEPLRYQVGEEDGEKAIFINTRFPLYKLRKNQLPLYTWETQIMEYAKAEDDGQTVDDYLEDINNMLRSLGKYVKSKNIKTAY